MKNYLLFLFLLCSISANCQYQRFSIGAMAGMSNASIGYEYTCIGTEVQYNFKRTFSIVSGIGLEQGQFRISDFHEFPYPIHYDDALVDFNNWNVPLMCRATFGKKRVFLYVQGGLQFYGTPKAEGDVIRSYSSSSGYPDEHFSRTYTMQSAPSFDLVYGGGLTVSISKNINFFTEFRDNPFKQFSPTSEENGLLSYSHFTGGRFLAGLSWQFNARKDSEYNVSNPISGHREK